MCITCCLVKGNYSPSQIRELSCEAKKYCLALKQSLALTYRRIGFCSKITCSCSVVFGFSVVIMVNFEFILPIFSILFVMMYLSFSMLSAFMFAIMS
jgi:hypothetical protein